MTIEMTEAIARVRVKAATLIRERGRGQHKFYGDNGSSCLVGALRVVSGLDVSEAIYRYLGPCRITDYFQWSEWNDDQDRNASDVIALLEGDTP